MGFEVYDYRSVNKNVLVTPEIRARLYHMKPGQVDRRHSHDLGHEVFLILEGKAEFEIEGTRKVLGPGEMCVALADEIHQVRNLLEDKPTIMYLSVTPHIQPTHTGLTDTGERMPPQFRPNAVYDAKDEDPADLQERLARHLVASRAVADAAAQCASTQEEMARELERALKEGDEEAAVTARNKMWDGIYALHKQVYALGAAWNDFSPLSTEEGA